MLPMMAITATGDTQYNDVLTSIQNSMGIGPSTPVPFMILGAIALLIVVLLGFQSIKRFIDKK